MFYQVWLKKDSQKGFSNDLDGNRTHAELPGMKYKYAELSSWYCQANILIAYYASFHTFNLIICRFNILRPRKSGNRNEVNERLGVVSGESA